MPSPECDKTAAAGHSAHRRHPRHHLAAPLNLWRRSGSGTMIPGIALEISHSGLSMILPESLGVGEQVEFVIQFPAGELRAVAVVRNRTMFRYGCEFEFLTSAQQQLIKDACSALPLYAGSEY